MKTIFFFVLFTSSTAVAQHPDYWLLGYDTAPIPFIIRSSLIYNGTVMDTVSHVPYRMSFNWPNTTLNDSSGNLLFYSNGKWVANRLHDTLKNSENFNPGYATSLSPMYGMIFGSSVLSIPKPETDSIFSLFHVSADEIMINGNTAVPTLRIYYSEINMNGDSGLGEMTIKNKIILSDTLVKGKLTGCKHANGIDWWIFSHEYNTTRYYRFLLTKDSLYGPFTQDIGQQSMFDYGGNQACFSPDGKWFASIYEVAGYLDIMQFDRCTGEFYNCTSIQMPLDGSAFWIGVGFSASSKVLYANNEIKLMQFDITASDIESTQQLIDVWDGNCTLGCGRFDNLQLASDNRIYMSATSPIHYFHRIVYPDSLGVSCNFMQRAVGLVNYNDCLPTYPNYDLGPLKVGCDTFVEPPLPETEFHFSLNPNPVSEQLSLTFHLENESKLKIYDVLGREVFLFTLYPWFKSNVVDVSMLPSGLYLYEVSDAGKRLKVGKFVKVRCE